MPKPCAAMTAMMELYTHVFGPRAASAVVPRVATQYASHVPRRGSATPVAAHVASCTSVGLLMATFHPISRIFSSSSTRTTASPSPATMMDSFPTSDPSPTYAAGRRIGRAAFSAPAASPSRSRRFGRRRSVAGATAHHRTVPLVLARVEQSLGGVARARGDAMWPERDERSARRGSF